MTAKAESEGRALLAKLGAEHRKRIEAGGAPYCEECFAAWPCQTARLIAALEEALEPHRKTCGCGYCLRVLARLVEEKPAPVAEAKE